MLSSMTGFAAESGEIEGYSWHFEVKTVNGRGLDVRLHLPSGSETLEAPVRAAIKHHLSRGNVQASLSLRESRDRNPVQIDTGFLTSLSRRARILNRSFNGTSVINTAELMAIKGVISSDKAIQETGPSEAACEAVLASVNSALRKLVEARQTEGAALKVVLQRVVADMTTIVGEAIQTADTQPDQIKKRLQDRVEAILNESKLSDERLEQEVAILVTKADVTEEIDRLSAHLKEASQLLNAKGAIGRKLDFLSQEMLREANTMGSKSASLEMTRHSLSLKGLIDQFKEQAANVE